LANSRKWMTEADHAAITKIHVLLWCYVGNHVLAKVASVMLLYSSP